MNWNVIIPIIGVVIAVAVFLFGPGILRKTQKRKGQIFCGIEMSHLQIPISLEEQMKSIFYYGRTFWILNIFVKNDSNAVCMNPIITIKDIGKIFGHVVNDTNEERKEIEESIKIAEIDYLHSLILKPKRLTPNSFVDLTVWASSSIFDEKRVSFSSEGYFEMKTKFIYYRTNEEKFK